MFTVKETNIYSEKKKKGEKLGGNRRVCSFIMLPEAHGSYYTSTSSYNQCCKNGWNDGIDAGFGEKVSRETRCLFQRNSNSNERPTIVTFAPVRGRNGGDKSHFCGE
ncbi:hypothetical protein V8G54_030069 [Vigna mungo]|uniref:Uncharacterized protein n=1 Tax=Vigna mungo TaxID=3915 RepID=A0AAQ3RMG9_VIGMU